MTGQGLRGPETRLNVFRLRLQRLRLAVRPSDRVRDRPRQRTTNAAFLLFSWPLARAAPLPSASVRPRPYVRVRPRRPSARMYAQYSITGDFLRGYGSPETQRMGGRAGSKNLGIGDGWQRWKRFSPAD